MNNVKTNRSLIAYLILSVLTFGLYSIWFTYKMKEDVNTICREDGKNTPGLIVLFLLSIVTCGIYALIWQWQLCERISEYERRHNMPNDISGIKYYAWTILGYFLCGIGPFVAMYLLIKGLNNISIKYLATRNAGGNVSRPSSNNTPSSSSNTSSGAPSRGRLSDFANSNSGSDSFGNGGSDSFGNGSGRGSDSFGNGGSDSFGNNRGSSSSSGKTDSFGNPIN